MARCKQQAQNGHQLSLSSSTAKNSTPSTPSVPSAPSGVRVSGPVTQGPERGQASSVAPSTTTTTTTTATSSTSAASAAATSAASIAQFNERGCEALLEYINSNHPLGPLL